MQLGVLDAALVHRRASPYRHLQHDAHQVFGQTEVVAVAQR